MAILRGTVVLNKVSGKPEDAVRNVWHFETIGVPASEDREAVGEALTQFYEDAAAQFGTNVSAQFNAHRVEIATVTPNGPGAGNDVVSPIQRVYPFTTVLLGGAALPNECAVALSFQGDVSGDQEESGTTRPRSRKRGRVFLGPMSVGTRVLEGGSDEPIVSVPAREAILDAYDAMHNYLAVSRPNLRHVVYSRVSGTASHVVQVRVDNEFDTVRSRGRKPSLRMTRSITQGTAPGNRSGTDVTLAS